MAETTNPRRLVEIVNEDDELQSELPRVIQAYAAYVEPKDCSRIVKLLSKEAPLPASLSHLKRVKKQVNKGKTSSQENIANEASPAVKRTKLDPESPKNKKLQVLVSHEQPTETDALESLLGGPIHPVQVPGRPPETQEEARELSQSLWPTHYFPMQSEEYKKQQMAIPEDEAKFMIETMESSVLPTDAAIVVDPSTGSIVSNSDTEATAQQPQTPASPTVLDANPLATPVLLALQGVSRLERQAAQRLSTQDFSKGQYLCTGYDLYVPYEPTIFEAMACVHSRLRRLIYAGDTANRPQKDASCPQSTPKHGGAILSKGLTKHKTHCLPGTNHHFRAFEYRIPGNTEESSEAT